MRVLGIILVVLLVFNPFLFSQVIFFDDFESGGFSYGGWTVTGNATITTNAPFSGNYCVNGHASYALAKIFSTALNTDTIVVEYAVKAAQTGSNSANFKILDSNNNRAVVVFPRWLGSFYAYNGSSQIPLMPYNANQWYYLQVVVDLVNRNYDVYIDGQQYADNFQFLDTNFTVPIKFEWNSGETWGDAWIDKITITNTFIAPINSDTFVSIYHDGISEAELSNLLVNDGASNFQSNFNQKVFIYKFVLIGGGGYYSYSFLKINFNKIPNFVIGKGTSDSNETFRVSIGADSSNMFGFNGMGWVNLTSYWTSQSIYVVLDSKWGTNFDTELDLWMAFDSPLDSVITYQLIRYPDSFDSFASDAYQVYISPVAINLINGSSFAYDLAADNASAYQSNFTGNYAYRIDIWGGGGYYSDCLLKFFVNQPAVYAISLGTSDENDNTLRTGVGKEVNHMVDVQQADWVDVTGEFAGNYIDFRLNSKWGTNHDSHIIVWFSTDNEIQNPGYSISMYPNGLGSVEIKKYDLATSVDNYSIQPFKFSLGQNYPNPFNPITNITYTLPKASQVKMVIYNDLGQEVRMLVNKHQPAGRYTVQWDGRDRFGNPVPSGVYFYKLKAGNFVQNRKMILMR